MQSDENEHAYTTFSGESLPPVTLESLSAIVRTFTDRRPAMLREVRIHPGYIDVFKGNLHEEGYVVMKYSPEINRLAGVPVLLDSEVPFGEIKEVYAGDEG